MNIERIQLILENPKYAGNTGMIARLNANFGLCPIRVFGKMDGSAEMQWMAVHAEEELDKIEIFDDMHALKQDLDVLVGTGMIMGSNRINMLHPSALKELAKSSAGRIGIAFGREDRGLSSGFLDHCDYLVNFDLPGKQKSMNLASSVAYVLGILNSEEAVAENKKHNEGLYLSLIDFVEQIFRKKGLSDFHGMQRLAIRRFRRILDSAAIDDSDIKFLFRIFRSLDE